MEFVTCAIQKLAELALEPMLRQVRYVIFYKQNLDEFNEEARNLGNDEEAWRHKADQANRNGEVIESGVDEWLQKANEMVAKAEQLNKENDEAKPGCLNLLSRHKLSRSARKMTDEITKISKPDFPSVSYRPTPQIIESLPSNEGDFRSRVECFNQIMEALKDPSVSRIGVYGLGGVGKTTLVRQVAKEAKENRSFDQVVLANVTQHPKVEQIQTEIATILGLSFIGVQGELEKAYLLHKRLTETTSLVILDDVWERLDLTTIGITSEDEQKHCKILTTSRDLDVLSSKMNTQINIGVGVLKEEEAWKLFKEKADLNDESSADSELLSLAKEICRRCGGLPIAILTIASALKDKIVSEWRDVLHQLQMPTSRDSAGTLAYVHMFIEQSYEYLGEELKSVFRLCGLMDYYIDTEELFQYSVGLRLFPSLNYGLAEARDKLNRWIRQLKDKSLLQDSVSSSTTLNMHDVVRDVAILMASKDAPVLRLRNQRLRQWPEKEDLDVISKILLYECDMELPFTLLCPKLDFFLLRNEPFVHLGNLRFIEPEEFSSRFSPEFFNGMPGLKILDLMSVHLTNLPASASLRTLRLYGGILENKASIGALSGLKVLKLSGSSIEVLPTEIGQLTQLQLLDLIGCHRLHCIPANILSRLKNLEEMYISDNYYKWGEECSGHQIKNASLAELMNLQSLTFLELPVHDQRMFPRDLVFKNLRAYSIRIGVFGNWSSYDKNEKTLQVKLEAGIDFENGITRLLLNANNLNVTGWRGASSVLAELDHQGFPHLKRFRFAENDEIQYISSTVESPHLHECFRNLESLKLDNVANLEKICRGPLSGNTFSKLRELSVIKSPKMKSLISYNVLKLLHTLEELQAVTCESLETVFELDGTQENGMHVVTSPLKMLCLAGLPNLRHVWDKDPKGIAEFEGLHNVIVSSCPNLEHFFPASVANNLSHLERLSMSSCGFKGLVAEGSSDGLLSFVFPRLTYFEVVDMPHLIHFYPGRYTTKWPQLREMRFGGAYELRSIFGSDLPSFNASNFDNDSRVEPACLQIEEVFPELERVTIYNHPDIMTWLGQVSSGQLKKTVHFTLYDSHTASSPHSLLRKFPSMKHLELINSSFEEIFPSQGSQTDNFSKQLRTVLLSKLPNLRSICKEGNPILDNMDYLSVRKCPALTFLVPSSVRFNNLTGLSVYECHGLQYLLTSATAKSLGQLKNLSVECCSMIKEIVVDMEGETVMIEFRQLEKLRLNDLGSLESFSLCSCDFKFPSLKKVDVGGCRKMKIFSKGASITPNLPGVVFGVWAEARVTLWGGDLNATINKLYTDTVVLQFYSQWKLEEYPQLQERWNGPLPDWMFSNLRTLVVNKCESLSIVLPHHVLKNLSQLEELEVQNCNSVEVIFDVEGIALEDADFKMDCHLRDLKMNNLPNLKHIWNRDPKGVLAFENLSRVHALHCGNLKNVFAASVAMNLFQLEELLVEFCAVEDIVAKGLEAPLCFVFPRVNILSLWNLPNVRSFYPGQHTTEWPKLKKLFLNLASEVQIFGSEQLISEEAQVVNSKEHSAQQPLFIIEKMISNVEALSINKMDFIMTWFSQAPQDLFSKLVYLRLVWVLDDHASVPYGSLLRIPNLKEVSLECSPFKEICHSIKLEDGSEQKVDNLTLDALALKSLPNLEHICKDCHYIGPNLDRLKALYVFVCPCLKNLVPSSVSLSNLTQLEVYKCDGMVYLLSLETARGLVQLKSMKIIACTMMKEIISNDEGDESENGIEFRELTYFELVGLSMLESFSSRKCALRFPLLTEILIEQCPAMKIFSNGILSTPRLQVTSLPDRRPLEGDLNTIISRRSAIPHT